MLQRLISGDGNPSIEKRHAAPPNKHRLNDRFVGDLLPRTGPYLVWDTVQHGLAAQVQPTGHKSFKVIYSRHGRSRWYHLANATAIKVAEARKLAGKIMVEVADGKDPAANRKASRHAGTFEDLAKRYAKHAEKKNKSWKRTDKLRSLSVPLCIPRWRPVVPSWWLVQRRSQSDMGHEHRRDQAADGCDRGLRPNRSWLLTGFPEKLFLHGQEPKRTRHGTSTRASVLLTYLFRKRHKVQLDLVAFGSYILPW